MFSQWYSWKPCAISELLFCLKLLHNSIILLEAQFKKGASHGCHGLNQVHSMYSEPQPPCRMQPPCRFWEKTCHSHVPATIHSARLVAPFCLHPFRPVSDAAHPQLLFLETTKRHLVSFLGSADRKARLSNDHGAGENGPGIARLKNLIKTNKKQNTTIYI